MTWFDSWNSRVAVLQNALAAVQNAIPYGIEAVRKFTAEAFREVARAEVQIASAPDVLTALEGEKYLSEVVGQVAQIVEGVA